MKEQSFLAKWHGSSDTASRHDIKLLGSVYTAELHVAREHSQVL